MRRCVVAFSLIPGRGSPMRVSTCSEARVARFAHQSGQTSPTTMLLPALAIQITFSDQNIVRVELCGELDALTSQRCGEVLLALLSEHRPDMVLDLSDLSFCDAGGLGAFVRL